MLNARNDTTLTLLATRLKLGILQFESWVPITDTTYQVSLYHLSLYHVSLYHVSLITISLYHQITLWSRSGAGQSRSGTDLIHSGTAPEGDSMMIQ